MDKGLETFLSVWGAALATILGALELLKSFRDRPNMVVNADLSYRAINEDEEIKGTRIETGHGPNEVLISITAVNRGRQPLQVTACFIKDESNHTFQVIPEGLPAVLEPNTQVQVTIQKEWLDDTNVMTFGVADALGRIHKVERDSLSQLLKQCNALPSNKRQFRHKETGELVKAFQVKDTHVVMQRRKPN